MTYDPNSTIPQSHEVRVTMRGVRLTDGGAPVQVSTRSDFIAPQLSGPSTHALEMEKGLSGWSFDDVPVETVAPVFTDWAKRDLAQVTCGTPLRKARATGLRVAHRTGPRAGRK